MKSFLTPGVITGVIGFLATVAGIFHYSALSVVLSDPNTASGIQTTVGLGMQLVAAFLQGVKPAAS